MGHSPFLSIRRSVSQVRVKTEISGYASFSDLVRYLYLCKEVDLFEGANESALEIRGTCEKAVGRGIDGCGKG